MKTIFVAGTDNKVNKPVPTFFMTSKKFVATTDLFLNRATFFVTLPSVLKFNFADLLKRQNINQMLFVLGWKRRLQ